jgi:CheY-like chemotaxis protein
MAKLRATNRRCYALRPRNGIRVTGSERAFMTDELSKRRILVIEDSPVVADASEDMLHDLGFEVVGPAGNMATALQLAQDEELDAAIVDVNIRGGKAYSVMKILATRNIPFLLTSGYADWSMPEEWAERPRLAKPYTPNMLRVSLTELLQPHD